MRSAIFTFLLLVTSLASAQNYISWASPVYHDPSTNKVDKVLTIGLTGIYTASFADAMTTREALADGAVERNPFLRPLYARAPGAAEAAKFTLNGIQVWGMKSLMRSCGTDKGCKGFVYVFAYSSTGFFSYLAVHNHRVATECRAGHC